MVVTVEMFGDEETFLLGSREITDSSMHVFSEKSPIGAAVNGARWATPSPTRAQRQPGRGQGPPHTPYDG